MKYLCPTVVPPSNCSNTKEQKDKKKKKKNLQEKKKKRRGRKPLQPQPSSPPSTYYNINKTTLPHNQRYSTVNNGITRKQQRLS
jgi:hypothetical protein